MTQKKYFFPVLLAGLFILFLLLTVPKGYFYGSYTDWLSQHVRLAETIRSACIEQKTLVPDFLPLGSGSNGYQFSYYGYLRPDILIGCIFPSIPMVYLVIGYMLAGYLSSVMLCYYWLKSHDIDRASAFLGSMLFMAAACFFHTHRQIMFINYMPFLILSLLAVRKKYYRLLPLFLLLIYVNSFYYAIACLVAIGWYWLMQEGKSFWKHGFACYLKASFLSIGMAAVLLIPTASVILEHHRASESLSLSQICQVSLNLQSMLYSPYGMGLTAACLYALLLGLTSRKYRANSIFLLVISTWCVAAWLLNGTLYARAKILVPFVPLMILQCARIFSELSVSFLPVSPQHIHNNGGDGNTQPHIKWMLWPCVLMAAILPFWSYCRNFKWIAADVGVLTLTVLVQKISSLLRSRGTAGPLPIRQADLHNINSSGFYTTRYLIAVILLCIMPALLYLQTMKKENFVKKDDVYIQEFPFNSSAVAKMDPLGRYDSLVDVLNTGNLATNGSLQKSAMYSSISNQDYSDVYYNTFLSPVQINNKLAILPSANPFLLNFLGVRYIETTMDNIPVGYQVISEAENSSNQPVLAENNNVLPIAYVTSSCIRESRFQKLDKYGRLDAMTRYTVVPDSASGSARRIADSDTSKMKAASPSFDEEKLPDSVHITHTDKGYLLDVKEKANISLKLKQTLKDKILLLDFDVVNQGEKAVVIDINRMRNKLSGSSAPYPNGNHSFSYQFSDSAGNGLSALDVTLSKGKYEVKNISWHTYDSRLLNQKQYTSVENHNTKGKEILSCTAAVKEDGYFATSIPLQKGMEIQVDGKNVPILKMNQAFAGVKLDKGMHDIRVTFRAPGRRAGYAITILCFLIYFASMAQILFRSKYKNNKHE